VCVGVCVCVWLPRSQGRQQAGLLTGPLDVPALVTQQRSSMPEVRAGGSPCQGGLLCASLVSGAGQPQPLPLPLPLLLLLLLMLLALSLVQWSSRGTST